MSFKIEKISNKYGSVDVVMYDEQQKSTLSILSIGACINSWKIGGNLPKNEVIDGYKDAEDVVQNVTQAFKGSKLSPYVCRLHLGRYQYNEQVYKIGGFYLQEHAIHGLLFSKFFILENAFADKDKAVAIFLYNYKALDDGYPFSYSVEVTYTLQNNNLLTITTTVKNTCNTTIPISDGWHPYFKLNDECIDAYMLHFDSTKQLAFDTALIPTKELIKDDRFYNGTTLKNIQLDNCFLLEKNGICRLESNDRVLTITPIKNYPYLQVYTPPHRQSIAIENLSSAPDAFNNGMGKIVLAPSNEETFITSYQVTVK